MLQKNFTIPPQFQPFRLEKRVIRPQPAGTFLAENLPPTFWASDWQILLPDTQSSLKDM